MQVRAAQQKLRCSEVPVRYRTRAAGKSKVSGTIKGTVLAGLKIISTIYKLQPGGSNENKPGQEPL
jgi:hypothetical protein